MRVIFKQSLIAILTGCLVLVGGCGYHSINQAPERACPAAFRLTIDNQFRIPGSQTQVETLIHQYFKVSAGLNQGAELRIKINPIAKQLTGFTTSGHLASKTFEVSSRLDVVEEKLHVWSVEHQSTSPTILHRTDPMWTAAAEAAGLRKALENSIAGLRKRYEAKCRRNFARKKRL